MILVLKSGITQEQADMVINKVKKMDLEVHFSQGKNLTILGLVGDTQKLEISRLESLEFVEKAIRIQEPFKRTNRLFRPENSKVQVAINLQLSPDPARLRVKSNY